MTSSTVSASSRGRSARPARTSGVRRAGVLLLGSVLSLLGCGAWLLSALLSAPLMLAGLWVWAREFAWADRLLGRFHRYSQALWQRVRIRPVRWGLLTATSLGGSSAAYWFLMTGNLVLV